MQSTQPEFFLTTEKMGCIIKNWVGESPQPAVKVSARVAWSTSHWKASSRDAGLDWSGPQWAIGAWGIQQKPFQK